MKSEVSEKVDVSTGAVGRLRRARRTYDEEFKRSVVDQIERSGRSQISVARSYEIDPKIIRRWIREYGRKPQGSAAGSGAAGSVTVGVAPNGIGGELELMELRARLHESEQENAILKKALVIFSRHQR